MQPSQNPQTSEYSQMPRQSYRRGRIAFREYRTSQSLRVPSAPLTANEVNSAPSAVQQNKVICNRFRQEGHISVGLITRRPSISTSTGIQGGMRHLPIKMWIKVRYGQELFTVFEFSYFTIFD